jgi:hypothetical protein
MRIKSGEEEEKDEGGRMSQTATLGRITLIHPSFFRLPASSSPPQAGL